MLLITPGSCCRKGTVGCEPSVPPLCTRLSVTRERSHWPMPQAFTVRFCAVGGEDALPMRHRARLWNSGEMRRPGWAATALITALLLAPLTAHANTCTTQGEMNAQDRETLASAGQQLGNAVIQQNFGAIQGTLLPAVAQQWEGIRGVIEQGAPYIKGGQVQLNALYALDATSLTAPADTQFFCSNANGSMTVTVSMH